MYSSSTWKENLDSILIKAEVRNGGGGEVTVEVRKVSLELCKHLLALLSQPVLYSLHFLSTLLALLFSNFIQIWQNQSFLGLRVGPLLLTSIAHVLPAA